MVEYTLSLDSIFSSLADPTRRDILQRVSLQALTVSDVAKVYDMTLAAISKHLKVLERAQLIRKERRGKQQFVIASPIAVQNAAEYLRGYEALWSERFDRLDQLLKEDI